MWAALLLAAISVHGLWYTVTKYVSLLMPIVPQDIIGQRADSLRPLLQHPRAHIYTCGSSNMAQEVCRALGKVVGSKALDHIVLEGR
jgi:hypothetical protein